MNAPRPNRRHFLKTAAAAGFLGLNRLSAMATARAGRPATAPDFRAYGFGPLIHRAGEILSLPEGFTYKIVSRTGDSMNDGLFVPGGPDGMAAFPGPDGVTVLVRNHELGSDKSSMGPHAGDHSKWSQIDSRLLYDAARGRDLCVGGTTTVVFDTKRQAVIRQFLSLAGTIRNCSGGPTPWGSWITCEETVIRAEGVLERDHGYNFEVPAQADGGLIPAVALTAMGRFNHEAVAIDPDSGIVYQTEDRPDGLIYRFIPKMRGDLASGGLLQALAITRSPSRDTRNWTPASPPDFPINERLGVEWIDLDEIDSPNDDLRYRGFAQGAARFARGEGMVYGNGEIYFACTNGGSKQFGQIFRYRPSPVEGTSQEAEQPGELELFIESHDLELLKSSDNLAIAPWGDITICEDNNRQSRIVGVTPGGRLYPIAQTMVDSELAGVCFSPDGTTLFVNTQWNPGMTFAITGPWDTRED